MKNKKDLCAESFQELKLQQMLVTKNDRNLPPLPRHLSPEMQQDLSNSWIACVQVSSFTFTMIRRAVDMFGFEVVPIENLTMFMAAINKRGMPFATITVHDLLREEENILKKAEVSAGEDLNPIIAIGTKENLNAEDFQTLPHAFLIKGPTMSQDIFDLFSRMLPEPISYIEQAKVLIVEDNPVNLKFCQKVMMAMSFEVNTAQNSEEALVKLENNRFHLILMDLDLPGKNGLETTIEIRRRGIQTPTLALTAIQHPELERHCMRCGLNGALSKPLSLEPLLDMLRKFRVPRTRPKEKMICSF